MKFAVEKTKHDVFELLLDSAALGEQVVITNLKGEALVSACVAKNVQLVELLIQNYAPVNFQNGAVLVAAVKDAEILPLVMATTPKPSLATLTAAFKEAIKLGKPALQFSVYSMLLDAGMKGELVDAALLAAVEIGSSAKATYTLLLDSGADINHSNGASMRAAIDSESVELLELLLTKGKASQPNLTRAFRRSYNSKGDMRLECTELVLKAGLDIQDEELSLKVLAEAKHPSSDHQYLRLLL